MQIQHQNILLYDKYRHLQNSYPALYRDLEVREKQYLNIIQSLSHQVYLLKKQMFEKNQAHIGRMQDKKIKQAQIVNQQTMVKQGKVHQHQHKYKNSSHHQHSESYAASNSRDDCSIGQHYKNLCDNAKPNAQKDQVQQNNSQNHNTINQISQQFATKKTQESIEKKMIQQESLSKIPSQFTIKQMEKINKIMDKAAIYAQNSQNLKQDINEERVQESLAKIVASEKSIANITRLKGKNIIKNTPYRNDISSNNSENNIKQSNNTDALRDSSSVLASKKKRITNKQYLLD